MNRIAISAALAAAVLAVSSAASAGPTCTTQPRAKWLTEAQMKAKIAQLGYKDIKTFKVSGSCYEIYGHTKDGKKTEVYFNPVDGAVVREKQDD